MNDLSGEGSTSNHVGRYVMTAKPTDSSTPFLKLGKEQTEAMLGLQKELLDAYEQASRALLARVKSQVDLWSKLAAKLAATRSAPEAVGAYQECVTRWMQNGRGRRAAFLRRLSKGHANDHGVTIQPKADRKHVKRESLSEWLKRGERSCKLKGSP
jgi:hypothetical protein